MFVAEGVRKGRTVACRDNYVLPSESFNLSILDLVLMRIGMKLGVDGNLIFVKSVTAMWRMQEFLGWNTVSIIPKCGEICNQ